MAGLNFKTISKLLALLGTVAVFAIICYKYTSAELNPTSRFLTSFYTNEELTEEQQAYTDFLLKYRKSGKLLSSSSTVDRFKIFSENLNRIKRHNSDSKKTTMLNINKFSDMTHEEIKAIFKLGKRTGEREFRTLQTVSVPTSVDWREKGVLSPIKDQGTCGSCWAFSTTGVLESIYAIKTGKSVQFSEQQLVDCSSAFGNYGCDGGLMDFAFDYIILNGLSTEEAYPYRGYESSCKSFTPAVGVSRYYDIPEGDNDQIAQAVALHPVSAAVEAGNFEFMHYRGGIITDGEVCGTDIDHAILIVGYGHDQKLGVDYWIVKNQWGLDWGEDGYVRILKQNGITNGVCGIATLASYPELK